MSRSSILKLENLDSDEDFHSPFVCVTNNPKGFFKTKSDLIRALQVCGRNPSIRDIDRYWKSYERIGYEEFCKIAREESTLTERELVQAFQDIDLDKNGFISYRELIEILTKKGDNPMSREDVDEIMKEADLNRDNKIDYREFSKFILVTIEKAKKEAKLRTKQIMRGKNDLDNDDYLDDARNRNRKKSLSNNNTERGSFGSMRSLDDEREYSNRNSRNSQRDREARFADDHQAKRTVADFDIDRRERRDSRRVLDDYSRKDSQKRSSDSLHKLVRSLSFDNDDDDNSARRRSSSTRRKSKDFKHDDEFGSFDRKNRTRTDRDHDREFNKSRENLSDSFARDDSNNRFRRSKISIREQDFNDDKKRDSQRSSMGSGILKKSQSTHKLFETKSEPYNRVIQKFSEPKNLKKWHSRITKGGFYYNEQMNDIISNSFVLKLNSPSTVFFSIQATPTQLHKNVDFTNMDVGLLIVKDEKTLRLSNLTEHKVNNKWCTTMDLNAGNYFLFPFTTGCHLKKRTLDYAKSVPKLLQKDLNNKKTFTTKFRNALECIFDMFDLDSNGRLSSSEFNFYSMISSDEQLSNDDWKLIESLVGLKKNELTKEGFIRLNEIGIEQEDFNQDDFLMRFFNVGFNKSLEMDQSCPFEISLSSERDNFDLLLGEIFTLKSTHSYLYQYIKDKGVLTQIKGLKDLDFYEYHNKYWSAVQIENNSSHDIQVKVNAAKSENCVSNRADMESLIQIKPRKSKIAMFLAPNNCNKEWITRYEAAF